ncbi:MAG: integrase, partial [Rhodoferax sp.]
MNESRLRTIAQLQEFLAATPQVQFTAHGGGGDSQRYQHISAVLARFDYPRCSKPERGVVRAYLVRTSGYSRAQLTRLVARWGRNRLAALPLAKCYRSPVAPFARKYNAIDIELLVEMDRANEDVCGPAIAHLLKRAWLVYGDARYERLSALSVSHLYNLRKSTGYQSRRRLFTKTRPVCNPIGVRRAPRPNGRVGFVRI